MKRILVIAPTYEDFRTYIRKRGAKGVSYHAWLSPLSACGYEFDKVVFLPLWRLHPHFVELNDQWICVQSGFWIWKRPRMIQIWRLAEKQGVSRR